MQAHPPLPAVAAIGLRYWDDRATEGDESALDAYRAAAAYDCAGLAVRYHEPSYAAALTSDNVVERHGRLCGMLAADVAAARRASHALLLTGASCSHAVGVVGGLQQAHGAGARIGIVWLDAHGDFNTPTTTLSGQLYGMPLAVCAGLALPRWRELGGMRAPIPADRLILVDARNLDPPEAQLIHAAGLTVAAAAPRRPGVDFAAALAELAARVDMIYLHVDTDVLDPAFMPSAHLAEPGGPSLAEVLAINAATLATGKVAAVAIASVRNLAAGGAASVASGVALIRAALEGWRQHNRSWLEEWDADERG